MTTTVRHFATNPDALDTYEDAELVVERDDSDIRIDAVVGNEADYPMGRPGVSIEMDRLTAAFLVAKLTEALR